MQPNIRKSTIVSTRVNLQNSNNFALSVTFYLLFEYQMLGVTESHDYCNYESMVFALHLVHRSVFEANRVVS